MTAQYVQLREPDRVHVFISHLWARDADYSRLVRVLSDVLGTALVNHSVPASEALQLLSVGADALEQERGLQEKHLAFCREQMDAMRGRLADLQRALAEQAERLALAAAAEGAELEMPAVEARMAAARQSGLGERRVRLEQAHLADLRERAARVLAEPEKQAILRVATDLRARAARAGSALLTLVHEEQDRTSRIATLAAVADPDAFNRFDHADVLARAMGAADSVSRKHPTLALELYHRLRMADIVVLLAGVNDVYREWMVFETRLIEDLFKATIAVQPEGEVPAPPEMLRLTGQPAARLTHDDIEARLAGLLGHQFDAIRFRLRAALWSRPDEQPILD